LKWYGKYRRRVAWIGNDMKNDEEK
jgi:hypothetical protein